MLFTTVGRADQLKSRIELLMAQHVEVLLVLYFNEHEILLFQDIIDCRMRDATVKKLVTLDPGKPPKHYTDLVSGKPIWEVIANGVHCKDRPGVAKVLIFASESRDWTEVSVLDAPNLPKPAWA